MFVTCINDCNDANAIARQEVRCASLFQCPVTSIGVPHDFGATGSLAAAGNLIDVLDAAQGNKGVVLVNIAPRNGKAHHWKNGTPFCYFFIKDTLVVSSVDGDTLSLIKKLRLVEYVHLVDVAAVVSACTDDQQLIEHISSTQFRSFEFTPRLAAWVLEGKEIPSEQYSLDTIEQAPLSVWWIDNFGNCKTTLLPQEVDFEIGKPVETKIGTLTCHNRLKDIEDGDAGLVIGSSGYQDKRFLEIQVQGVSAAKHFNLQQGSKIL